MHVTTRMAPMRSETETGTICGLSPEQLSSVTGGYLTADLLARNNPLLAEALAAYRAARAARLSKLPTLSPTAPLTKGSSPIER
jgi:hypothetical protein